ncbi:MAG TPA: restriction endonuclease subunit S [Rhodobacteraceae bacterium]|nr:restriction endonuclease subunit S [Paracoccaceae bacterium]
MGEWKACLLGDIIELKRGYDLPKSKRKAGNIPIISSSGFSDTHIEAKVNGPGVITGRYGTIGTVYYVEEPYWPLNTTLYVRDFKGNDPRFVSYFLRGIDFMAYSDKAAVPGVNRNHLHQAQVLLPPLPEQRAIASVLSALDDKIDLNQRMNATLERQARALFADWFVHFGPTRAKAANQPPYLPPKTWSLFPDRLDDKGVPEGWEEVQIKDFCLRVESGGTPSRKEAKYWENGTVPWLTSGEVRKPIITRTDNFISNLGLEESSAKLWPPLSTVVAMYGATAGQVTLLACETSANQACCALVPKQHTKSFIFLKAKFSIQLYESRARGSAQQNLNKTLVSNLETVAPAKSVLERFEEIASPLIDKMIENELESRTLAQTRDLLLPKLMSGEVRVREGEGVVEDMV